MPTYRPFTAPKLDPHDLMTSNSRMTLKSKPFDGLETLRPNTSHEKHLPPARALKRSDSTARLLNNHMDQAPTLKSSGMNSKKPLRKSKMKARLRYAVQQGQSCNPTEEATTMSTNSQRYLVDADKPPLSRTWSQSSIRSSTSTASRTSTASSAAAFRSAVLDLEIAFIEKLESLPRQTCTSGKDFKRLEYHRKLLDDLIELEPPSAHLLMKIRDCFNEFFANEVDIQREEPPVNFQPKEEDTRFERKELLRSNQMLKSTCIDLEKEVERLRTGIMTGNLPKQAHMEGDTPSLFSESQLRLELEDKIDQDNNLDTYDEIDLIERSSHITPAIIPKLDFSAIPEFHESDDEQDEQSTPTEQYFVDEYEN